MAGRSAHLRFAVETDHLAPRLAGMLRHLSRQSLRKLFDSYHPERHYMRGPGPRWRAKHERARSPADRAN